tara:strand:- start:762 stop:1565 length:804 start_codon:yes stop_codon:yes gene_type:complete
VEFTIKEHLTSFNNTPELKGIIKGINHFKLTSSIVPVGVETPSIYRLGKKIEFLFELILKNSIDYKLLLSNFQIQEGKLTVGEIDYIIKTINTKSIQHIELSYKFYLLDNSLNADFIGKWIGPNRKDFLHLKRSRLKNHQFPILKHKSVTEKLNQLNIKRDEVKASLLLKAQLFIPQNQLEQLPQNFQNCVVGIWVNLQGFQNLNWIGEWCVPDKIDWYIDPIFNQSWVAKQKALATIQEKLRSKYSALIWHKTKEGNFKKIMVVWW